jgi:cytochrome c biogenesis protein CcmG/thiol:disulfide interchange protein DsbE
MRHIAFAFCNSVAVRRALIAVVLLAVAAGVVVAVAVGVKQARDSDRAPQAVVEPLSREAISRPVPGTPPELAALRARVNVLRPGGERAFDAQLRALRGHPVVVNLWASWCDPCRFELPFLQREAVRHGARVAFLGINVNDERGAARAMAARFPMPYPSFEDPRSTIAARYHARGLPSTAFYDARGKLVIVHQGVFPSEAKLAEAIDRYALRG